MSIKQLIDDLRKANELFTVKAAEDNLAAQGHEAIGLIFHEMTDDAIVSRLDEVLMKLFASARGDQLHLATAALEPWLLAGGADPRRQREAIRLAKHYPSLWTSAMLTTLAKHRETPVELRVAALKGLLASPFTPEIGTSLANLLVDADPGLLGEALRLVELRPNEFPYNPTIRALEQLLVLESTECKDKVLRALGSIAEIDVVERVLMLPLPSSLHEAVGEMVMGVCKRPRNVLKLRPDNFEFLVHHLARRYGYEEVEHVGRPNDEGVDVIAVRYDSTLGSNAARATVVIQCKRYATDRPVDAKAVEALANTMSAKRATEGLLITTSDFTKDAKDLRAGRFGGLRLHLFNGVELQRLLDHYFGTGTYTIRAR